MHKLINLTLDEISEDLVRLGVGASDYKTVEERELEKAQTPKEGTVSYKNTSLRCAQYQSDQWLIWHSQQIFRSLQ